MYLPVRFSKTGIMKRFSASTLFLAVTYAVLATAPAMAQQSGNGLFGDIFKPPAPVQNEAVVNQQSELLMRMDRIENQLRQLTGQVEQLQYRNQQLEQQLNARGGAGAAAGAAASRPVAVPPPATAMGKRSDAFDPNEDPSAPGVPQPLGSPASAAPPPVRPTGAPLDLSAAAQRTNPQVAALPPSAGPKDMYDLGLNQVQRQDFAAAEQTLRQFLQTYPTDRLTPDATYLLGESLYQRQTYKDAAEQFLQVSTKYPNSTRAPEALLRLGQSLAALNEREAACATFGEVDRKFPRAASSVRQAVEREQKRAGC